MSHWHNSHTFKARLDWVIHFAFLLAVVGVTLWSLATNTRLNQTAQAEKPVQSTVLAQLVNGVESQSPHSVKLLLSRLSKSVGG